MKKSFLIPLLFIASVICKGQSAGHSPSKVDTLGTVFLSIPYMNAYWEMEGPNQSAFKKYSDSCDIYYCLANCARSIDSITFYDDRLYMVGDSLKKYFYKLTSLPKVTIDSLIKSDTSAITKLSCKCQP